MGCWSDNSDLKKFCDDNGDGCYWGVLGDVTAWTCCCSGDYCNDCASGTDCSPKPMPDKCTKTDAPPTQQIFSNSTSTLDSTKTLDNHHNQAFATKSLTSMFVVLSIIYIIILF
uniref:Uncharacterized protein n=1 Tax=Acrobeloides nanus TaxID=290746 RepID=A0A914CHX3_9BILA